MIEQLTRHRVTSFEVMLLDAQMGERGQLKGVRGGEISLSAATRLRASGRLQLTALDDTVDFVNDRIRIAANTNGYSWTVGTFVMSAPSRVYSAAGSTWQVELLSVLSLVDTWSVTEPVGGAAGWSALVDAARVMNLPLSDISSDISRVSAEIVWPAGTSLLRIANDTLQSIGYAALTPSADGGLSADKYIRPAQRPTVWEFREGDAAVHLAEWDRKQDVAAVPNRVVLVGQGSADSAALVGVAENRDADSAYSFQARKRWVTHTETNVEAADQATLDGLARRKLIDLSSPQATLRVSYAPLPVRPGDVVLWHSQGHRVRASIHDVRFSLSPTGLFSATLKEVVDL